MGLRETFQIIIDVATESGQKSLKQLRKEVGDADGAFAKMKVAGSGGLDYLQQHAAAFAVGAGVAIAGFGIKAVGVFEDTAKAAIDMSKTTGLSVTDASRWIGVAEDYRIGADTLTGSIGKITKSISDVKWAKFGIATHDAAGQARDANDILLDTLSKLSAMPDKTAQAQEGFKLFGKGFGSIAPLLGHTRDEYVKMLGAVEDGQVITSQEAKKAETMRLAQDKLKDAFKEMALAAGNALAEVAPLVDAVAGAVTWVGKLIQPTGYAGDALHDFHAQLKTVDSALPGAQGNIITTAESFKTLRDNLDNSRSSWDMFSTWATSTKEEEQLRQTNTAFDELLKSDPVAAQAVIDSYTALGTAGSDAAKSQLQSMGITIDKLAEWQDKVDQVAEHHHGLAYATEHVGLAAADAKDEIDKQAASLQHITDVTDAANRATQNLKASWDAYRDALKDKQAVLDISKAFDDLKQSIDKNGVSSDETKGKIIDLDLKLADYAQNLGGLPPEVITMVQAQIDDGSFKTAAEAIHALDLAAQSLRDTLAADHREFDTASNIPKPFTLADVATNQANANYSPTYNVTVNGANMTPEQIINAIKTYERKNGPGWKTSAI